MDESAYIEVATPELSTPESSTEDGEGFFGSPGSIYLAEGCTKTLIHGVPDDVLMLIFLEYRTLVEAQLSPYCKTIRGPHAYFIISYVCQRWRYITLAMLSFWQHVTTRGSVNCAILCLERSKDAPLYVDIRGFISLCSRYRLKFLPHLWLLGYMQEWLLNMLGPQSYRIQHLTLDVDTMEQWNAAMSLLRSTVALKSLSLFPLVAGEELVTTGTDPIILGSLNIYRIHDIIHEALAIVPITPAMSSSLTHLQIAMKTPNRNRESSVPTLSFSVLLNILHTLPRLRILDIRNLQLSPAYKPNQAVVSLPCLRNLHLRFPSSYALSMMALIHCIHFPADTCLVVHWVAPSDGTLSPFWDHRLVGVQPVRLLTVLRAKLWPEDGPAIRHLVIDDRHGSLSIRCGGTTGLHPDNIQSNVSGMYRLDLRLVDHAFPCVALDALLPLLPLRDVEMLHIPSVFLGSPRGSNPGFQDSDMEHTFLVIRECTRCMENLRTLSVNGMGAENEVAVLLDIQQPGTKIVPHSQCEQQQQVDRGGQGQESEIGSCQPIPQVPLPNLSAIALTNCAIHLPIPSPLIPKMSLKEVLVRRRAWLGKQLDYLSGSLRRSSYT
ncbi:hypothetical protein BXZ70DRAFT_1068820 [Cristinia sonorae]|uniref:F-box domain-containing protein n=1 Tax=Cristinia sonorae TaxID=1940300 RepID=A0A8K0UE30_9AGAR|nr:hypothetical protein BXZ70DRAFT_1068820 [Cristinia sonorae]